MKIKSPHPFVIVFFLVIFAAICTLIVPGGEFERVKQPDGSQTVLKDSFTYTESNPQILTIFTSPLSGFIRLADIIAFIFFIGGAFNIVNKSGAITAGVGALVRKMGHRRILIITVVMFTFSFFGAFFGMCEEAMPFVLIFVPLSLSLGYDSIVGLCLSFLAAGVGFATAFFNPFTVQIAQKLSGLPPVSGWEYRISIWFIITSFTIIWVIRYAEKIRKNPELSPTCSIDHTKREKLLKESKEQGSFNIRHAMVLLFLGITVIMLFIGVIFWKWYIKELAGLFIAMGIATGIASRMPFNKIAIEFIEGAKDIAGAALLVGLAAGILVILEEGRVIDTLLFACSNLFSDIHPILSAYVQYAIQLSVNFFIPSGTTKAALTMPVMAPLADLSGITRQTAVLAYQFGDGFTNMIIPTSAVTIGTLELAGVPFEKWFRWLLPLEIVFVVLSLLLLIPPVLMQW